MSDLFEDYGLSLKDIDLKLIRRWIKLLRSRKLKQGQGKLRIPKSIRIEYNEVQSNSAVDLYCCLGAVQKLVDPKNDSLKDGSCFLPEETLKKIGISHYFESSLADMNDDGKKFYQIANFLERVFFPREKKKNSTGRNKQKASGRAGK